MSIYIDGIHKPERCIDCHFLAQNYIALEDDIYHITSICDLTHVQTREPLDGILPDCPIIEVEGWHND